MRGQLDQRPAPLVGRSRGEGVRGGGPVAGNQSGLDRVDEGRRRRYVGRTAAVDLVAGGALGQLGKEGAEGVDAFVVKRAEGVDALLRRVVAVGGGEVEAELDGEFLLGELGDDGLQRLISQRLDIQFDVGCGGEIDRLGYHEWDRFGRSTTVDDFCGNGGRGGSRISRADGLARTALDLAGGGRLSLGVEAAEAGDFVVKLPGVEAAHLRDGPFKRFRVRLGLACHAHELRVGAGPEDVDGRACGEGSSGHEHSGEEGTGELHVEDCTDPAVQWSPWHSRKSKN